MTRETPLHIRAISLVLALSVVVGGWLALEYNSRSQSPTAGNMADTAKPRDHPPDTEKTHPTSETQPAQSPRDVSLTFKCQKNGRTSFSDKPCDVDARVISVTASEKSYPVSDNRMNQMKRQVAQMEADRHVREQAQAASFAARAESLDANKALQCKEVDGWVAYYDSRLRHPHDGQLGDFLTGERKKWMDRRFELRC